MKPTILLLFVLSVALGTTGCMSGYAPSPSSAKRLSLIPTPYEGKEIDVIFPGEKPKDTAYVKIALLEEKAEGEVAYATLLEALTQKAKLQGMDGMLVLGKNQSSRIKSDITLLEVLSEVATGEQITDNYYSVTTHELAAVGFKYRKNLGYLPSHVKARHLLALEDNRQLPLAKVEVDHQGFPVAVTATSPQHRQTYETYVQPYDLDLLLREETPEWRYQTQNGQLRKRKFKGQNGAVKTVKVWYNDQKLPSKLEVHTPAAATPDVISLTYNSQKQVVEKLVTRQKQSFLKEINHYSPAGKLLSTQHLTFQGGKEKAFLKTEYEYYAAQAL